MSVRRFLTWQSAFAALGLALCLLCLPVAAVAQRGGGGHGSFGGGGFRGGGSFGGGGGFGGARMAAPAPTFQSPSFGSRPMTSAGRFAQPYRGVSGRVESPRYARPRGVPRSSYYRPATRPPAAGAGPRGFRSASGSRFAQAGPRSTGSISRHYPRSGEPGQGWQRFGGHHHQFLYASSWLNGFYNPYFFNPFFWAPYPLYSACTPYYSDYGDESGPVYTGGYPPPEENEAEAPAEENAEPESEPVSGEAYGPQFPPAPVEQTVVVDLPDGRTKTFTWQGDKMTVTESPAPSKPSPAAPTPQSPAGSLQP
jgi:hypothetical protein